MYSGMNILRCVLQRKMKVEDKVKSSVHKYFGFELDDLKSWKSFVLLMNRGEDPSSLAFFRIGFGILMLLDIPHERAFSYVDHVHGKDASFCRFPLFNFLKPFPVVYMSLLYIVMLIGAIGITLGLFYRFSAICFTLPYWYIFLLDKSTWNNHSYLYGLFGLMFCVFDAHHFWSVDGIRNPKIRNRQVPLWNYFVLRSQVFLVYFIAGLKKTEYDWLAGYSFTNIGKHWVFFPFRLIIPEKYVTWFIVHGCGFIIDLFCGFFLFFDSTRWFGTLVVTSFHLMNAQMFHIGVFPYTMLLTTTVFYANDWPKRVCKKWLDFQSSVYDRAQFSSHCVYPKSSIKSEETEEYAESISFQDAKSEPTLRHKIFAVLSIFYFVEQLFLPYSHFITKGYNNWTNGLYGYSWDMMVHSWHTQHVKVTLEDLDKNKTLYIDPHAFAPNERWCSHADMIKQFADCLAAFMREKKHKNNFKLKIDIWKSLNNRFIQRQVDPNVDMVTAEWNPFRQTSWILPLLTNLSNWRNKLREIESKWTEKDEFKFLTFVADFPGFTLDNYISDEYEVRIEVLSGKVQVEIPSKSKVIPLTPKSHSLLLPKGTFHKVHVTSSMPACYFYIYENTTYKELYGVYSAYSSAILEKFNRTKAKLLRKSYRGPLHQLTLNLWEKELKTLNKTDLSSFLKERNITLPADYDSGDVENLKDLLLYNLNVTIHQIAQSEKSKIFLLLKRIEGFFRRKFALYRRTLWVIIYTFRSITTGECLEDLLLENYDMKVDKPVEEFYFDEYDDID